MTRPTRPGLLVSRGGSFLASAEVVLVGDSVCAGECVAAFGVGGDGVGAGAGDDDPAAIVEDWGAGAGDGASGVGADGGELSAAEFVLASRGPTALLRGGGGRKDGVRWFDEGGSVCAVGAEHVRSGPRAPRHGDEVVWNRRSFELTRGEPGKRVKTGPDHPRRGPNGRSNDRFVRKAG
jgi:hypothetical protein